MEVLETAREDACVGKHVINLNTEGCLLHRPPDSYVSTSLHRRLDSYISTIQSSLVDVNPMLIYPRMF